jgi:hypothetical protein
LGILSNKNLVELVNSNYDAEWKSYQDEVYLDSGLWPWEQKSIDHFFKDCKTLVIGAAGGGREIFPLSAMGFKVDAFDCNEPLQNTAIRLLAQKGIECRYELAEPDCVPESLGIYDGLIVGWSGYSHIIGRKERIQFLTECRQHVHHGSPILISFFTRGERSPMFSTIYHIGNAIRSLRLSNEKIEYGDTLIESYLHYFNQGEIMDELHSAGFDLEYYSDHGFGHAIARAI